MAGLYGSDEYGYVEVLFRDGKLSVSNGPPELIPLDRRRFTAQDAPDGTQIEFGGGTPAGSAEVRLPGQPPRRYSRVTPVTLSETERQAYTGDFKSAELQVTYRIVTDGGALRLEVGDRPSLPLTSAGADRMRVIPADLEFVFARDAAGNVSGFRLNAGRVRGIVFSR